MIYKDGKVPSVLVPQVARTNPLVLDTGGRRGQEA